MEYGYLEGDVCKRRGCKGIIREHEREGCYCHISPPCSSCVADVSYCPTCDWEGKNDEIFNGYRCAVDPVAKTYTAMELRKLDPTKIDWHSKSHTHFSMIKEGVYPEGTTREEVERLMEGIFGGRFEYFCDGRFKYIAYTD